MKPQEIKFTLVYNEAKQCILEGQIPPGNALPSSKILCSRYHVGRYTINRILDVLRREGLVDIQPRLAPIATLRKDVLDLSNTVFNILKQREDVLQVYKTFVLILPSLLVFALQGRDVEIMPHYKKAIKTLRLGNSSDEWCTICKLGSDILRTGGNFLFSELYSSFYLFSKLTLSTEECPYFAEYSLQGSVPVTGVIIDVLKGRNPFIKYSQLSNIYQNLTDSIEYTSKYLSDTMSKYLAQTGMAFSWNPICGQDYCCLRTVDDLNLKTDLGEYSVGIYPLYEKQLASRYDASLSTVRKALLKLEQRGLVKTLNGKDTIVIKPDDTKLHRLAPNSGYVEKALRYLHALQLMALATHPATLAVASKSTRTELDELAGRFTSPGGIHLADMFKSILKHITLEPLYVILSETGRLLEWGHHFTYYPSKRHTFTHLNRQVILALQQLSEGSENSFADGIGECYRYLLIYMKKHMVEKYKFHNVAGIRVPPRSVDVHRPDT